MKYVTLGIFFFCFYSAHAQKIDNRTKLSRDFINFFEGSWVGEGQFASGKKIEAEVSFKISLDSCWITNAHHDKLPNRYKATSMWGIDKETGKFLAYVFDNFQGHRLFTSEGWRADSLVLTNKDVTQPNAAFFQTFVYKKTDVDKFKMSYEVSKDSAIWKVSDWLIFRRVSS